MTFDTGAYPAFAAARAKDADIVIVFATQWTTEGLDVPDLNLPSGQNELIAAVDGGEPQTIVVLETGGPVVMPWLDKTAAVLEAWYPGITRRRRHRRHTVRRRQPVRTFPSPSRLAGADAASRAGRPVRL